MTTRKPFPIERLIGMAAAALLLQPMVSCALSLGEISLQSRLGEPLRAQVPFTAENNERVDDSCLSLLPPEAEADRSSYLLKADLSVRSRGERKFIAIVSHKPINDAFVQLRLQVKCRGMGSMVKSFMLLPDMEAPPPQEQVEIPAPPSASTPSVPAIAPAEKPADNASAESRKDKAPSTSAPKDKPAKSQHRTAPRIATERPKQPEVFRLKLSGDPIDASRIGKISPEERAALLAQQKLLDADDQTASFLALQHQVKLLQDELGAIKLQLAQLSPASGIAPPGEPSVQPQAANDLPARAATDKQTRTQTDNPYLQNGLFAALGLLIVLLLWQALRRYNRIKSGLAARLYQEAAPIPAPLQTSPPPAPPQPREASPSSRPAQPPIPSVSPAAAPTPDAQLKQVEISEEDAMLEEARLYAAHGRPVKAIELLQEITRRIPSRVEPWSLLLSLYSSLGKTAEFGNTAREFMKHHQDDPTWSVIQALGRTLDPEDSLYADKEGATVRWLASGMAGPRRQVGEILMEMGALSQQDLQNCLDDYIPEKHGRLGGYLVARKVITLAQLDQALLLQQGIGPEKQPGELPSLQEVEKLLSDFDPKRDGSVSEFLAARSAAAAEPPDGPLQQAGDKTRNDSRPQFSKDEVLDFVLETSQERPALDLEFDSGSIQQMDLEVSPATPEPEKGTIDFPEIQLDFGDQKPSGDEAAKP